MRIAVFARSTPFHRGAGGMERVSWDLVEEWRRCGHQVVVFTTPLEKTLSSTVELSELPGRAGRYSAGWFEETRSVLASSEFDIAFGVSAGAHGVVGRTSVPVVMQAHGTALNDLIGKFAVHSVRSLAGVPRIVVALARDLSVYRKFAAVVAIGPTVQASLSRIPKRLLPQVVTTIENGVKSPSMRHRTKRDRSVVFVGRLVHQKGVDIAIRAMKDVDARLTVIGAGPEGERLKALVNKLNMTELVEFAGALDHEAVLGHLSSASVVVVPSRGREGLPAIVPESILCGARVVIPVRLAANLGELTKHEAVSVAESSPSQFAQAIKRALEMEPPTGDLPDNFSLSWSAQRYIELFEELVDASTQSLPRTKSAKRAFS